MWCGLASLAFGDVRPLVVLPPDCDIAWLRASLPSFRYREERRRLLVCAHPQWLHLPAGLFAQFVAWLYTEAPSTQFIGGADVVEHLSNQSWYAWTPE